MIFERLNERTHAVGLYADDAVNLNTELEVYAAELERLSEELDRILRESFVVTAEDEGLSVYERIFGAVREDASVEQRREMLVLRMMLGDNDFTPAGFSKAMDSLGVSWELSEYPGLQRMNITVLSDHTPGEQAFIRSQVAELVPAHLEWQLTFNTLTWDQMDRMDRTFTAIDSEALTWDQIDNRMNEE